MGGSTPWIWNVICHFDKIKNVVIDAVISKNTHQIYFYIFFFNFVNLIITVFTETMAIFQFNVLQLLLEFC